MIVSVQPSLFTKKGSSNNNCSNHRWPPLVVQWDGQQTEDAFQERLWKSSSKAVNLHLPTGTFKLDLTGLVSNQRHQFNWLFMFGFSVCRAPKHCSFQRLLQRDGPGRRCSGSLRSGRSMSSLTMISHRYKPQHSPAVCMSRWWE